MNFKDFSFVSKAAKFPSQVVPFSNYSPYSVHINKYLGKVINMREKQEGPKSLSINCEVGHNSPESCHYPPELLLDHSS